MYTRTHTHTYIHTHARTHTQTHTHARTHTGRGATLNNVHRTLPRNVFQNYKPVDYQTIEQSSTKTEPSSHSTTQEPSLGTLLSTEIVQL